MNYVLHQMVYKNYSKTDRPYPDIDELRITSDGVQKLLENR